MINQVYVPNRGDIVWLETINPILEIDEIWSFVGSKKIKFGHGLHWKYKHDLLLELFFSCAIFQMEQGASIKACHRAVGKENGQTAHIERFNNTLLQRCPNLVRKTPSFS